MAHKTTHVLLNYMTRPLVLTVGSVYVLVVGIAAFSLAGTSVGSRMPAFPEINDWGSRFSTATPAAIQKPSHPERFVSPDTARVIEFRFAATDRDNPAQLSALYPEHLHAIRNLPKVRALTLQAIAKNRLTEEHLAELAALTQLEALSLIQCDLPEGLWDALGKLPRLTYLDLSGSSLHGHYTHLESLRHVKTLVLGMPASGPVVEIDAPLFPELQHLPMLQSLVVRDYVSFEAMQRHLGKDLPPGIVEAPLPATNPLTSNLADLRAIPTLRRLFVNEDSLAFPGFPQLSQDLPAVKVRPDYVHTNRQMQLFIFVLLNSIPLFLLAIQLQSQFAQPAACLVPGYAAAHLSVAACLWMGTLAVNTLLLTRIGISPPVALATNLAMWGLMCSFGAVGTATQLNQRQLRFLMIPVAILMACIVPMGVPLILANRSTVDWYMRGNEPIWTYGFIFAGIAATASVVRQTSRIYQTYLERGISSPPLSLDPVAMNAWGQQVYWQNAQSDRKSMADRRLEHALASADKPGWRQRCNLWISGNAGNGKIILLFAAIVISACSLAILLHLDEIIGGASFLVAADSPMILLISAFLPDFGNIAIVGFWRSRRPLFAMESLRSTSRLEFTRQIAAAIAWDMMPLAIVYLGVLTWYVWRSNPTLWSIPWTLGMLLVFVARWTMLYGLILWSLTIRKEWVLILIAAISGYAMICVNMLIIFLQGRVLNMSHLPPDLPDLGLSGLFSMATAFGIVAAWVASLAYRRWRSFELA